MIASRPEESLIPCEHSVAFCLMRGLSNSQICVELSIQRDTLRTYLKRIYSKYGLEGEDRHKRLIVAESYTRYVKSVIYKEQ